MTWVQTSTGKAVDLLDPQPDQIDIRDIAAGLSRLCRFNGQLRPGVFYSVAQHSVLVARTVPTAYAVWGLLHDAHEAYLGDIVTPVGRAIGLGCEYLSVRSRLDRAIYAALGLPWPTKAAEQAVKRADKVALVTERRDLMAAEGPGAVDYPEAVTGNAEPLFERIQPWGHGYAEAMFLEIWEHLATWRGVEPARAEPVRNGGAAVASDGPLGPVPAERPEPGLSEAPPDLAALEREGRFDG